VCHSPICSFSLLSLSLALAALVALWLFLSLSALALCLLGCLAHTRRPLTNEYVLYRWIHTYLALHLPALFLYGAFVYTHLCRRNIHSPSLPLCSLSPTHCVSG
ncbi:hypothetical protein CABS01_11437, partial [Colletotrichum abscissum]|uniref:uncharacterized protein n=1 Tax=Colletotrichum abscissum TaxID=1671311 RepID=UPI0027D6CC6B